MSTGKKSGEGERAPLPAGFRWLPSGQVRWEVMLDGTRYSGSEENITLARKARATRIADHQRGFVMKSHRATVKDRLNLWLENKARGLKPKTMQSYRDIIRLYVVPNIGDVQLSKLRPGQIAGVYKALEERGLSYTVLNTVKVVLTGMLTEAVTAELIPRNVAADVKFQATSTGGRAVKSFTREEATAFRAACQSSRWGLILEFMLSTGLRVGEACGLGWDSVNLEQGKAHIWQVVSTLGGKVVLQDSPKTQDGERTIYLSSEALALLERSREQYALEAGHRKDWTGGGFVFSNMRGTFISPYNLNDQMQTLCERAGVQRLNLHGLRHTYATLSLRAGVPVAVVSKNMGHKDITITLKIYRHVLEDERREHTRSLSDLLK